MIRPSAARLAAHAEADALVAAFIASGRVVTGAAEPAPVTAEAAPVITCDGSVGWASRYLGAPEAAPEAPKASRGVAIARLINRWTEQVAYDPRAAQAVPLQLYIARNVERVMSLDLLRSYYPSAF